MEFSNLAVGKTVVYRGRTPYGKHGYEYAGRVMAVGPATDSRGDVEFYFLIQARSARTYSYTRPAGDWFRTDDKLVTVPARDCQWFEDREAGSLMDEPDQVGYR